MVEGQPSDRLDPVDLDQPALADDRDAVAGAVDLVDDVRREEDRPSLGPGFAHELEEGLLDERVEAGRRLVEDQQVRPVLERHDQADLLLVALRVLLELGGSDRGRAARRAQPTYPAIDPAAQVREVGDRVGAGQPVVEVELAGQVADPAVDRDRVHGGLDAEDLGAPGCRADEVEQDAHRRRLARAVRPEEAEDLALGDVEVELGDAPVDAVGLGQPFGADDRGHEGSFLPAAPARSWRKRSITTGTSRSMKAKTSRISWSRARDSGGRSAIDARPRSAISRKWR